MSWSVFACRPEQVTYQDEPELMIIGNSDVAYPAFREAANQLQEQRVFGIDGLLAYGGLGSSSCANAIKQATGLSPYAVNWQPERVKELAERADWSFPAADARAQGSKLSAQMFLNLCAQHGLGISTE